jgi:septal ring factor EnvC (AmiA/AmiB activator)
MAPASRFRPLSVAAAACLSLTAGACSVEQARNKCADESTSPDGLIECARKMHASAGHCESGRRGAATTPVAGRLVIKFGELTKHGGTSQGMVFEGAAGGGVRAPIGGLVTFADPWRSYGDLVIIDDCKTVALMAGTLSPEVMAGQSATAGDVVATMRQTSSDAPVLYLELREDGTVVDPAGVLPPG